MDQSSYRATGKRKSAIAQVTICKGKGQFIINKLPGKSYLQYSPKYLQYVQEPLTIVKKESDIDVFVSTSGGGISGQASAIRLGISRALCVLSSDYRALLKPLGCLTRDSRIKERRKYGLKKARKAPQYSKR